MEPQAVISADCEKSSSAPELSMVRLRSAVDGAPAGAVGTVVHRYRKAGAVEVEFADGLLVTAFADQLEILS